MKGNKLTWLFAQFHYLDAFNFHLPLGGSGVSSGSKIIIPNLNFLAKFLYFKMFYVYFDNYKIKIKYPTTFFSHNNLDRQYNVTQKNYFFSPALLIPYCVLWGK